MKHTIRPYVTTWQDETNPVRVAGVVGFMTYRVWAFDDPSKGLINEGLVSGTDKILDTIAARFPNGEDGFVLHFSDEPFEGSELTFEWVKEGTGADIADGISGNWYREPVTGFEGWLCPALFKYFSQAPKHIYVKAEALDGKLERGTGKVIIQVEKE